jgi:hypothetical protein
VVSPSTAAVVAAWLALAGTGLGIVIAHGVTPGAAGEAPAVLPDASAAALRWSRQRPLVVVCAHPQCPCLQSTVGELRRVLRDAPAVNLRVLLFAPASPPPGWEPRAATALSEALPDAAIVEDPDGAFASALGAETSGHVLVYDRLGALRFSGGVTSGRAHRGDNAAARNLGTILSGDYGGPARTAVFGCPLSADTGARADRPCCKPD